MAKEFDVEAAVDALTEPTTFNLKAALSKKTSPEDTVKVYLDGKTMHEINILLDGVLDLESALNSYKQGQNATLASLLAKEARLSAEANGGITDDPEKEEVTKELAKHRKATAAEEKKQQKAIDAQNAEVERLLGVVRDSALTFKLRGIIPKQNELIVSKWERKMPEPARGDYNTESEFNVDWNDVVRRRNRALIIEQVQKAIVSVAGSDGVEHGGGWSYEDTAELWDVLDETERTKLREMAGNLTFAETLFNRVATEDADFLPSA